MNDDPRDSEQPPTGRGVPQWSKSRLTREEKAKRWDQLITYLAKPSIRDSQIRHLSAMRRATQHLLASREELPDTLATELRTYLVTLDELFLEVETGFAGVNDILDFLPSYVTESLAGQLCQRDTDD